jgi:hypothetical protein
MSHLISFCNILRRSSFFSRTFTSFLLIADLDSISVLPHVSSSKMKLLPSSVLLLAHLARLAAADYNVIIKNFCPFKVFIHMATDRMVAADPSSITNNVLMATLDQGQTWTDPYRYPAWGGVSIKIARTTPALNEFPITQFEYGFWRDGGGDRQMMQDLSNVDCGGQTPGKNTMPCPFQDYGMIFEQPGCKTRECRPGEIVCHEAYHQPHHDFACSGCFIDKVKGDSTLELCNYNVASTKLRRSRIWHADMDSSKNIRYMETQAKNTTQLQ